MTQLAVILRSEATKDLIETKKRKEQTI